MPPDPSPQSPPEREDPCLAELAETRRRFLAKCGKVAVYTAPATVLLLTSPKAIAASGTGSSQE